MKKFDTLIEKYYGIVLEQDAPSPDMGSGGGAPSPDMGSGGGAPPPDMGSGGETSSEGEMDNELKREQDPKEYTRSVLSLLVDKKEGITPKMFDEFIDSVSFAITKIKDKNGIKQFYGKFYNRMQLVLDLREELKEIFNQLSNTLSDLVASDEEPNDAGGGEGMAGPSGPGVK